MTIPSSGTPEFWRIYAALPADVKALARKNYRLWQGNAFHPSLHFKSIGSPNWSVRIGDHYRAIGKYSGSLFFMGVDRLALGLQQTVLSVPERLGRNAVPVSPCRPAGVVLVR